MPTQKQPTFAAKTTVAVEKTQIEIQRVLRRWGATAILAGHSESHGAHIIQFKLAGYTIRFMLPLLERKDFNAQAKFEQAERTQWRGMLQAITAKLNMTTLGILLEDEFLANIVNPATGQTHSEEFRQRLLEAYKQPEQKRLGGAP